MHRSIQNLTPKGSRLLGTHSKWVVVDYHLYNNVFTCNMGNTIFILDPKLLNIKPGRPIWNDNIFFINLKGKENEDLFNKSTAPSSRS